MVDLRDLVRDAIPNASPGDCSSLSEGLGEFWAVDSRRIFVLTTDQPFDILLRSASQLNGTIR